MSWVRRRRAHPEHERTCRREGACETRTVHADCFTCNSQDHFFSGEKSDLGSAICKIWLQCMVVNLQGVALLLLARVYVPGCVCVRARVCVCVCLCALCVPAPGVPHGGVLLFFYPREYQACFGSFLEAR